MFTAKNICFLSPSVCSRCWLPSTASNLVALLKEGKKYIAFLNSTPKKWMFQIKVLWKEQTSSPAHNDNLNWIEKFQYATAATAAATSSSIYSISIQARCCFALFHPQHNCGYMCSFTWAQINCVWFYWFYITCLPTQRNFRLCIDLNVCCTERTVSSFRSYLRKSKYCEGDRRPIVVLDWTLNGVGVESSEVFLDLDT